MLTVEGIYKTYEGQPLLRGVSFDVDQGETLCLLGPSGSGKSTLLRIIAGLEQAESGRVLWQGQDLSAVAVHLRHFGLMFQDYALFPHRNVRENVAFGLRMQGLPGPDIERQVEQALQQVNLAGFSRRRVTDLSGGEQQRVALARALAPRPRLLMLDEPLGALDRALREQLVSELRALLHQTGIPTIYVTHDQEEAFTVADRMILLHDGIVQQAGMPQQLFRQPASPWAARFLGQTNILDGNITSQDPLKVKTSLGEWSAAALAAAPAPGSKVSVLLRPGQTSLQPREGWNALCGRVEDVVFQGQTYRIELQISSGQHLRFDLEQEIPLHEDICLWIDPQNVLCLPGEK